MPQIQVNNVDLYYEIQGNGKPVLLVHGNGGSHKDLQRVSTALVDAGYQVYALDSRGQGANKPLSEYHYQDMAEDVFQFVRFLRLRKPAFYGWSDGGIIGLLLEILHPGTISRMAISGANIYPCTINGVRAAGYDGPICGDLSSDGYSLNDPLVRMMQEEPRISLRQLQEINIPILVTAGSDDVIPHAHTLLIAQNLPYSSLKILRGESHGSYTGVRQDGTPSP